MWFEMREIQCMIINSVSNALTSVLCSVDKTSQYDSVEYLKQYARNMTMISACEAVVAMVTSGNITQGIFLVWVSKL